MVKDNVEIKICACAYLDM